MFSVDTEAEAEELLDSVCFVQPYRREKFRGCADSRWVATQLAEDQTLENLWAFGDVLREAYAEMKGSNDQG